MRLLQKSVLMGTLWLFCVIAQAAGDGLWGQYYNYPSNPQTLAFTGLPVLSRIDASINFNWGTGSPGPGVQNNYFAVAWTGQLEIPTTGWWQLQSISDDGIRVYVDWNRDGNFTNPGEQVINDWTLHAATTDTSARMRINAGKYPIRVEFFQNTGFSLAQLLWKGPGVNRFTTVPKAHLYSLRPPTITGALQVCGSMTQIELDFSAPLDPVSATNAANYRINNGIRVLSAMINPVNANSVILNTSALSGGTTYTITVSNVKNTSGTPVSAGSTASVTPTAGTALASGLFGTYYSQNGAAGAYFTGTTQTRVDGPINFNWGSGSPMAGIGPTNFSTKWDGYVLAPRNDNYTFSVTSDDGSALWINNQQIINAWVDQAATTWNSAPIALTGGQYYPVHLEFYQHLGVSSVTLAWQSARIPQQPIPLSNLYYCSVSPVARFAVVSTANASTCTAQSVTLTAQDATGRTVTNYTGTIRLTTSSGHGNWSAGTAKGLLVMGAADSGSATYTFAAGDNGVASLQLSDSHADNLTITATSTAITATGTSAAVAFRDNAFVISTADANTGTNVDPLGTDIVAGRPHTLQAQMWTRNGANCRIATSYTGLHNLKAWITRGAQDPGGAAPQWGAAALPNAQPGSNNISVNFTAGLANFTLSSSDVGQYALNLTDDSSGFAQNLPTGSRIITGGSQTYVIRPFGFAVDFSGNRARFGLNDTAPSYADNANVSPYFQKTGQAFAATITAVLWQAADDPSGTGVPGPTANLYDNPAATHFNAITQLSPSVNLPLGGALGTLTGNTFNSFARGSATQNLTYSEVGIINLTVASNNYLGGGHNVTNLIPDVGRFVPDHFALVNGNTRLTPACVAGATPFTYMGQNLGFTLQLQAQNTANAVTNNYRSGFDKLSLNGSNGAQLNFKAANVTLNPIALTSRLTLPSWPANTNLWTNGITNIIGGNISLSPLANPDGDFKVFTVGIAPVDSDGVRLASYNFSSTGGSIDAQALGVTSERYGRLLISDAAGSELLPLALAVNAQYFGVVGGNNSDFVANTDDSCTVLPVVPVAPPNWGDYRLSNYQGALAQGSTTPSYVLPSSQLLSRGTTTLTLSAPNATGSIVVSLPSAPPYLRIYRYNSPVTGIAAQTPSALVTFGIYGGRPPIIYWRENFR